MTRRKSRQPKAAAAASTGSEMAVNAPKKSCQQTASTANGTTPVEPTSGEKSEGIGVASGGEMVVKAILSRKSSEQPEASGQKVRGQMPADKASSKKSEEPSKPAAGKKSSANSTKVANSNASDANQAVANSSKNKKKATSPKKTAGAINEQDGKKTAEGGKAPDKPGDITKAADTAKETREPINEEALPRLASDLIFPLVKKSPRFPMATYFCRLCSCHINTLKYVETHIKTAGHKKAKDEHYMTELFESIPWPPADAHCLALNSVLNQTVEEHGRTFDELQQCFQLADYLTGFFQQHLHPKCVVRLYGSSCTGFALKTSNVNLELIYPSECNHAWALTNAYLLLTNAPQLFSYVERDFGAKWPSIRFYAVGIGFLPATPAVCVLSVCNGQAHEITMLLATYYRFFPQLRELAQLIRYWAKLCHLDDAALSGLPAYAFDLMLVHYLQQRNPPALPIFHEMKELNLGVGTSAEGLHHGSSESIVRYCIDRNTNLIKSGEWNLAELWIGFLKYYTLGFDNQNIVVNIRSSKPVTREEKDWRTRRLSVEDPFIPNKNVAQMSQQMFDYTTRCFRLTYKYFGIPQTKNGPLFEFGDGYRLVLGNGLSHLSQETEDGCKTVCSNDNNADVQQMLLDLIQEMQRNEVVQENTPCEKVVTHRYERMEMLNLHRDDYQWNAEWSSNCNCSNTACKPERGKHGIEHAQRVVGGGGSSILLEEEINGCLRVSNGSDDCEDTSQTVTYVPSSSGMASPAPLNEDNGSGPFDCAKADIPADSFQKLRDEDNCCASFIGCGRNRQSSTMSDGSDFSSAYDEAPSQIAGFSAVDLSDCIEEEDEEIVARASVDDSVAEAMAAQSNDEICTQGPGGIRDLQFANGVAECKESDQNSIGEDHKMAVPPDLQKKKVDTQEGSTSSPVTLKRKEHKMVDPILREAAEKLSIADYLFVFSDGFFTGGKIPEVMCAFCNVSGHHANVCPEKKLPPLVALQPLPPVFKVTLDQFLNDIGKTYAITVRRLQWQETFRAELERAFQQKLRPDVRLALFGSSCNGFGFIHSDLDLCLTFDKRPTLPQDEDPLQLIKRVANVLKKDRNFVDVLPVTRAKVPIVRFLYWPSRLDGDISLYNCLALRNTELLRTYALIDARVRTLGYIVKVFAKFCDIGDASRGSLSSYAYVIMMLHYLQRTNPPVIPVLQELCDKRGRSPFIVDGWDTYFYSDLRTLQHVWKYSGKNKQSLHDLWLGFLRYYTEIFEAPAFVIQMRRSEPLTKFEKLWSDKALAIEDPFDLNHNLASGLSWRMYIYIMKVFIQAREAFGHPRHERILQSCFGNLLTYEALEKYFFERALRPKEPPPKDGLCKYCGHVGHFVERCPFKKPKQKVVEQVAAEKGNKKVNEGK